MTAVTRHVRHGRSSCILPGEYILDSRVLVWVAVLVLAAITGWSYWSMVVHLFYGWQSNDDYSSGQLVPPVAAFLLWRDRKALSQCRATPCWWGIGLILLAQADRTYGLVFMFDSLEKYSLGLSIAGLVLFVAGWQVFRRVAWVLLFLFLMFPLPGRLHNAIAGPLQRLATGGAVFLLEAFGVPMTQQGNVVNLGDGIPVAVAEACSGLRMLTAFVIVAAFIAYMIKRPRWHKSIVLVSSIPVAVACNIVRIFLTAVIMLYVSVEVGERFFHDFAGLVMMPIAVSLIFGEIWVLDRVIKPNEAQTRPRQAAVIRALKKTSGGSRGT